MSSDLTVWYRCPVHHTFPNSWFCLIKLPTSVAGLPSVEWQLASCISGQLSIVHICEGNHSSCLFSCKKPPQDSEFLVCHFFSCLVLDFYENIFITSKDLGQKGEIAVCARCAILQWKCRRTTKECSNRAWQSTREITTLSLILPYSFTLRDG